MVSRLEISLGCGTLGDAAVRVEESTPPLSHQVPTHATSHADDKLLLMDLMHEQLHRFEKERDADRDLAIEEVRTFFPPAPVARPKSAFSKDSPRLHRLLRTPEFDALAVLAGMEPERQKVAALGRYHYRRVYRTVLSELASLWTIILAHRRWPDALAAGA